MKKVLKSFGRYLLLDHLAQGGMAEIFRAWVPSVDGGGRVIVLKCVQPDFGQDLEFLEMFRSEIRVSIGLNHPNIVQLHDFGQVDGRPFIAMELVEGKSLKQIVQFLYQDKKRLPVEFGAYAIEQVARGLFYAHTHKDRNSGENLDIVHRDVSPQNLLVSYNGNVKIIDFGIAKVKSSHQQTRAGVIKGKPSYLSPEQISGEILDGRSDVFSLGAVLWEVLTGRKLFSGESDLAAIKLIDDCDAHVKPPSSLNPEVPPEIDAICLKALTHDRDKRYQTAEEFQRALHRAIYAMKPNFDPSDFSAYMEKLFKKEIDSEQKSLQELTQAAHEILKEASVPDLIPGFSNNLKEESTSVSYPNGLPIDTNGRNALKPGSKRGVAEFPSASPKESSQVDIEPTILRRQAQMDYSKSDYYDDDAKGVLPIAKILIGGGVALVAILYLGPYIGINFLGSQSKTNQAQTATESHEVPKTEPSQQANTGSPPISDPPQIAKPTSKVAILKLNMTPAGGAVSIHINNQAVNGSEIVQLPLNVPLKIVVEKEGFKTAEQLITATVAGDLPVHFDLEPSQYGLLTLHSTPNAKVQITQGDLRWIMETPMDRIKFPPGSYQIRFVNDLLGMEKSVALRLDAGKSLVREESLSVMK